MLERWPDVAAALPSHVECDVRGNTLLFGGVQLTTAFDRKREAETQATLLPADQREVWLYGLGLGELPTELLKRVDVLHVVIMNREMAAGSLGFGNHEWMHDPRVELHMGGDLRDLHGPICVSPTEVRLADEDCWHLRDRLMAILNYDFNMFLLGKVAEYVKEQERINLELQDPVVSQLIAQRRRFNRNCAVAGERSPLDTCYVIGGGPSLNEQYDWLRGKRSIVACNTAVQPLLRAGIVPDYVVALDQHPGIAKHFSGIEKAATEHIPLVYAIDCAPAIPLGWGGPRYVLRDLFAGGSVLHACVDLAVEMGAKTVYLVGADFCYRGGHSHATGATADQALHPYEPLRPRVRNGLGELTGSDPNYLQFNSTLEDYIDAHPGVKFLKRGRTGMPTRGASWDD